MFCPHCGTKISTAVGRCPGCAGSIPAELLGQAATLLPGDVPAGDVTRLSNAGLEQLSAALGSTPPEALTADAGPLALGEAFGSRYRVLRMLGSGGMGVVYQAWDNELGVPVALKVIRPAAMGTPSAAGDLERRFKRELLLARQVSHRNVVRIHDLGDVNGTKYISMAYVEGRTLAALLAAESRLPLRRALHLARQVAHALAAAHEVGVVHRDLKPENIMVGEDDEALVMDFGIARSVTAQATMTAAGNVVGTLEYMAPEQARAQPADHRADIYAFGLLLYDMLAGRRRLASSESAVAELMSRLERSPQSLRAIDPHMPAAVDRIIQRCLRPNPDDRYQSAAELVADLAALDASGERVGRRQARIMSVAVAGAVLALTAAAGMWVSRPTADPLPASAAQIAPVSVLITDFDNRTGDQAFDGALEQPLGLALEEASFISLYRRADARRLTTTLVPDAPGLDRTSARLVSTREGIDLLIAGAIAPDGAGYRLSLEVIDPQTDAAAFRAEETVDGKTDVLAALPQLAQRVRAHLGESATTLERPSQRETFTAASLDAAREYSRAQDLQYQGRDEEAIMHYQRAVAIDPNFGRAYSGWAVSAYNLGRQEESAEAWKKAVSMLDRMTEREKHRMLGVYYAQVERNFEKSVEAYEALVREFPADRAGRANLAVAYFYTRQFQKALDQSSQVLASGSKDPLHQSNHALFAMYAGDFGAAATQAEAVLADDPQSVTAYVPLAIAALSGGDQAAARKVYDSMAASGSVRGVSIAQMGRADLEMSYGRYADVPTLLTGAIAEDQRNGSTAGAAIKQVALAEAYIETGRPAEAVAAAKAGLALSRRLAVTVPAARILVRAGRTADARAIVDTLRTQVSADAQAYAHFLDGELAMAAGDTVAAVDAFRKARERADLWLARLGSGIALLAAGQPGAALAEFESCEKRQGEAVSVFLDDVPSYRYLSVLPYWLGRAQEALGVEAAAAANYTKFVERRADAGHPLVSDAHRRLQRPAHTR